MEPIHAKPKGLFQNLHESVTLKLIVIGILVLVLLIPASWIQDLISERQSRAENVVKEISEKWSDSQTIGGPVLVIPFTKRETIKTSKGELEIKETNEKAYFLPEKLSINGALDPKELHRGIFEAVVYTANLEIIADFTFPDFEALNISPDVVQWKNAYMIFPITDLGGVYEDPQVQLNGKSLITEPASNIGVATKKYIKEMQMNDRYDNSTYPVSGTSTNGIIAKLKWQSQEDFKNKLTSKLILRGSERLSFVPTGKSTVVNLQGSWNSPSFDGEFLPDTRNVTGEHFVAKWSVLHYNRPFSQQWIGENASLAASDFGLKLLVPVEQYQKSIRTAKYGQLVIILTFVALFLVEITRKIRIHPFQYILIGAALIIYYTLLLSIAEQLGYTAAYWIATGATVALVSLYSSSFLKSHHILIFFSLLLTVFYSFIFVIILQQDFSLLIGSIGLFLVVAALMFFSRKVTWYKTASAE